MSRLLGGWCGRWTGPRAAGVWLLLEVLPLATEVEATKGGRGGRTDGGRAGGPGVCVDGPL
jgi:hypothetical protein